MSSNIQSQTIGKTPASTAAQAPDKLVRVLGASRKNGCWWDLRYSKRIR